MFFDKSCFNNNLLPKYTLFNVYIYQNSFKKNMICEFLKSPFFSLTCRQRNS